MLEYDIHIHTESSNCSNQSPKQVVEKAESIGLDGIAITNHNKISGVKEARNHASGLDVISGTEITTDSGDLLALFIDEYPTSTKAIDIVKEVHMKNGIVILAHPCDPLRNNYNHHNRQLIKKVDAVEQINSRCVLNSYNRMARKLAEYNNKPVTAGSDAHFPFEIGRATVNIRRYEDMPRSIESTNGRGMYLSGHIATKLHQGIADLR